MCGMCGIFSGINHWSTSTGMNEKIPPRAQRLLQVQLANQILSVFKMRLDDFHGQMFFLHSATGASYQVQHYSDVWQVAEKILGFPLDPLTLFQNE